MRGDAEEDLAIRKEKGAGGENTKGKQKETTFEEIDADINGI